MKRKSSDSTNYKYDMYDSRGSKRFKSKPATRKRTWKEFGKQAAGTAAASTLGFIQANTPGAIVAGRKTWEYLKPDLEVKEDEDMMAPLLEAAGIFPKKTMGGAVTYGNRKFSKPSKKFYSPLTKYQAQGVVFTKEVYGKVTSPDCIYICHSTYDQEQLSRTIALCILRKLFKKAGYDPTSTKEAMPMKDFMADSAEVRFQITTEDIDTGTLTNYAYDTDATDSLDTIVGATFVGQGFSFFDYINLIMAQNDTSTYTILNSVRLFTKDNYGPVVTVSDWRLKTNLNMKNEIMKIYSHSRLVVQNATKGAASGSADDTAVDAQPLTGYFYQFAGGAPASKQRDNTGLSRLRSFGLQLHRAQDLSPPEDFKEPPLPATFNNCYKASAIGLEPGTMKRADLTSTWSGYFNNILFGSLTQKRGASLQFNTPGKSQLIALEEALNSGSTNLITTSYQSEKKMGVMLITGPKPIMIAKHEELQYNLDSRLLINNIQIVLKSGYQLAVCPRFSYPPRVAPKLA